MPIHLRAEPGAYAESCVLPGDPVRARWLAERFLDDAVEVNGERGLLGYTGTFDGRPVSVQASGMGTPSAAIVVEELVELGVRRLIRLGTCGSLSPRLPLGELLLALSAVPADGTTATYLGGEAHAPTSDWDLLHGAVHAAKELGRRPLVGPVATCDVFYEPDPARFTRWAARGVLAVEMEAAVLFTLGALRGVQTACLLVASDVLHGERRERIAGDALRAAMESAASLALRAVAPSQR